MVISSMEYCSAEDCVVLCCGVGHKGHVCRVRQYSIVTNYRVYSHRQV